MVSDAAYKSIYGVAVSKTMASPGMVDVPTGLA